ncbi:hypothetical protein [Paenibacillus ihumii]|uniref:hypothetical protein n=1 Tax=Paenibacillus ihumii TaxID=687436 RepID=UPI0006D7BEAD|nr:hypothetical protein [Paenibacillus ihumii]
MQDNFLSDAHEVDPLVKILKMAYELECWEKVIFISDKLLTEAEKVYRSPVRFSKLRKLDRPIAYYFGYSYLMKGSALQKLKQYDKAKECIKKYENLDWLGDDCAESKKVISDFKFFAHANTLTLDILIGSIDKLPEYTAFLLDHPDEILSGLITILEAALDYSIVVDKEINLLMPYIKDFNAYNNHMDCTDYLSFYFLLSIYRIKHQEYHGSINLILHILNILSTSDKIGYDGCFKKAVATFEAFRSHATQDQLKEYQAIQKTISEGVVKNEESAAFSFIGDWNSK